MHTNHKTLTDTFVREEIMPVLDNLHELFLSDFDCILQITKGLWLDEIKTRSIQDILQFEAWTLSEDKKRFRTV